MKKKKFTNPICLIVWQDAAYSFEKDLPKSLPTAQIIIGFVIAVRDGFVNVATNVRHDKKTTQLEPLDGFLIPEKTVILFKKVKNLTAVL